MDQRNHPDTPYSRYRRAAEEGDSEAQNELSILYSKGYGVAKNEKVAFKWCKLAAEQGTARAQCNLGMKYHEGKGIEKDHILAHMWINIAAINGLSGAARVQDIVSKMMSANQIEKAQDFARECIKNNDKGF